MRPSIVSRIVTRDAPVSDQGDQAMALLSNARKPEAAFFHSWTVFLPRFSVKLSV